MKAFTIRDIKAESWSYPFGAVTPGLAMRTLQQQVPETDPMRKYSADFALFETGVFDVQTGTISGYVSPVFIIELNNLFEKENTPQPTYDANGKFESDKYHGITTQETTPNGS